MDKSEYTRKKLRLDDFTHLENFRSKVLEAVSKIFVSKPPRKKVTGALHKETVASKEEIMEKKKIQNEEELLIALNGRRIREIKG